MNYSLMLILLLSLVYSASVYAQVDEYHNPCPENEIVCLVDNLEDMIPKLKNDPNFHEKFLAPHMGALAAGYAKLGNFSKAEQYRKLSIELSDKHRFNLKPNLRVLEQYIHLGKHDWVIDILQNSKPDKECEVVTQIYAYNKDFNNLKRVLLKTECTVDYINPVCHAISIGEFKLLYSTVAGFYDGYFYDNPDIKILNTEAVRCLEHYARKRIQEGELLNTNDLVTELNPKLPEENHEALRARIIDISVREKQYEHAIKEIKQLKTLKNTLEGYEDLIGSYAYHDKIEALYFNIELHNYLKQYQYLITENKDRYLPDYQRLYGLMNNNRQGFETKFLVLNQIQDPQFKVRMLFEALKVSLKMDETNYIHQETRDLCQTKMISNCIYNELEKAYNDYKKRGGSNYNFDLNQRFNPENLYIDARALMGDFDKEANNKGFKGNIGLIAKESPHCNDVIKEQMEAVKSSPINYNHNYSQLMLVLDCVYTSGLYKTELLNDKNVHLNDWQQEIAKRIPSRMIGNEKNVLDDIQIAHLNIPDKVKSSIIDQAMHTARRSHANISDEKSNAIFEAIQAFLESGNYYEYRLFNNLYHTYKNNGWNDKAENFLKNNQRFKDDLLAEQEKAVERKNNPKPMKLRDLANNLVHNLYQTVLKDQEYVPRTKMVIH